MRVLVLAGGRSAEWEISIISSRWVSTRLREAGHSVTEMIIERNGCWLLKDDPREVTVRTGGVPWGLFAGAEAIPFDAVFPVLHGAFGEDGTIQGFCATAGWPCAGVPVMGSAVAMEKHTMKSLAAGASIPVVKWVFLDEDPSTCYDCLREEIGELGFPLFVKPSRLGSSVGISRADSPGDLPEALARAAAFDSKILIEKAVMNAREIEVSVLGNGAEVMSSFPGEILPGREWYDFEAKYHCSDSKLAIPADLSASQSEGIRMMAEKAFRLIGGRGFARVDFLLNEEGVWLNEVNTIPGFTDISMFPKLWLATGKDSLQVLNFILEEAVNRGEHGLYREI
jgi:D-alanine-D-alanine ligase